MRLAQSILFAAVCSLSLAPSAFGQWTETAGKVTTTNPSAVVGIGTPAPAATLDVADTAKRIRLLFSGREYYQEATSTEGIALLLGVNRPDNRQLFIGDSAALKGAAPATVMRVMVGWTRPTLDAISIDAAGNVATTLLRIGNSGNVAMVDAGGRVGVGTADPQGVMDVRGKVEQTFTNTPITMRVGGTDVVATPNAGAGIGFDAVYTDAGQSTTIGAISAVKESVQSGHYAGALTFGTRAHGTGGGSMERMRITSSGEVIIGPAGSVSGQKLTVNGDVTVHGNIGAKFQDLAEWVDATDDLTPGTVVVLNPGAVNQVTASARPYDTTVAGVVSMQPGIILGEAGPSREQVATMGRVKVRVDATRSPIRVGDLLVTSDKPGTAMKSQQIDVGGIGIHRPGTVLGKALEPLESGVGEILVLLSLQ